MEMCGRGVRPTSKALLALGIAVLALPGVLGADVVRIASLDERIGGASKVVVATARRVDARWEENALGDRLIVSRVHLEVHETLKGTPSQMSWLDVEGGTLDGLTLQVSTLPAVRVGDRAVFFLDDEEGGVHRPYLRGQGILFLTGDNVVRGSSLRLNDIRTRARVLGQ